MSPLSLTVSLRASGEEALLIQVETDAKITGLGECATFGASMTAILTSLRTGEGALIGQEPVADIEPAMGDYGVE